jgi:hypothetical protein
MQGKELIEYILLEGTPEEKKELFAFTVSNSDEEILKKFQYWGRSLFPRYFTSEQSEDHIKIGGQLIKSYRNSNELIAGYRGLAKTALGKLFIAFVLLNDQGQHRKYLKVVSLDYTNAQSIVTDVYNLMVEVAWLYGDMFDMEGKIKREETMGAFKLKDKSNPNSAAGIKISAGTIGKKQRGHLQDNARPDWIIFEDIEDSESISSQVKTRKAIIKAQEAIDGLDINGNYLVNCNYISEDGVVQWFMDKPSVNVEIYPIATNVIYGRDEKGKKIIEKADPTWPTRYTLAKVQDLHKDAEDWFGEYMVDPAHSENKFFDTQRITEDMKKALEPKHESAGVKYWADYLPHHRYGQGSDHSEGSGDDANTLAGFDFNTGELVYTYANNEIAPDLATHQFAKVGRQFGNCVWAPETNNRCGGIAITTARSTEVNYPNLFSPVTEDKRVVKVTNQLGWYSTGASNTTIFMEFRTNYNDGEIIIYDIEVLKEMKAFTNKDLIVKTTGLITRHFDLLRAVVIAWQMHKYATQGGSVKDFYKNLPKRGASGAAQ